MLGRLLGAGMVAEAFEWGSDVIKLYHRGQGKEQAFREAATLAMLEGTPLGTPSVHGVVNTEGRWGVVMSRAPGEPLANIMRRQIEEAPAMLAATAALQRRMHQQSGSGLPRLQDRLREKLAQTRQLTAGEIEQMQRRLQALPDGDRLCHGDFHPFNIIGTPEAPVIIDWLDATQGPPEADACRSYLILMHNAPELAGAYLDAYVAGGSPAAVLAWLPVLAAARLVEGVRAEDERLVALVRNA